jgi:hypothetical protein
MDIHALSPVAGKDYPRTWNEFQSWFATEQDCANYLAGLRWPSGFICPACQHFAPPYKATRGRLLCIACKHQTSATAETIFSKTRTPLKVWLAAAWYLTNQKHGVCGNAARTDLCGGHRVTGVPTATNQNVEHSLMFKISDQANLHQRLLSSLLCIYFDRSLKNKRHQQLHLHIRIFRQEFSR